MRSLMLAILVVSAQAVLPYGAAVCVCEPGAAAAETFACCDAGDAGACECGCTMRAGEPDDSSALVPTPVCAVDAVAPLSRWQPTCLEQTSASVVEDADLPGDADVRLSRAQRAPPA